MISLTDYENFRKQVFHLDDKIRYVGIFHHNHTYMQMRDEVDNYLSPTETIHSLIDTVRRWKIRESLCSKIGRPLYAMAEYDKIKRITIPFNKDGIILVSCEPELYHEIITKEIIEIRDSIFPPRLSIQRPMTHSLFT